VSGFLLLLAGREPADPIAWALADDDGALRLRGVGEPAAHAPARTVLVIPGADARLGRLDLPAETEAQARAAAALLFERSLAQSEDLHFAVGAQQQDGARLVAAIARPRLEAWLEACRRFGADPHVVTLDCAAWPAGDGEIAIAELGARTIVAGGARGGFTIESNLAPSVFPRWAVDANLANARVTINGGEERWRAGLRDAEFRPREDPLEAFARGLAHGAAFAPNLRQGEFAAGQQETQPWRFWRFAALLAVAALTLQVATLSVAGWRDRQTAARVMAVAEGAFREARPDVGRVVNLRAQTSALLNAIDQGARHPVLVASQPVIDALRAQPLARIDEVRHETPGRAVRLTVSAPDPRSLEAVITALRAQGIAVEQRDAQPRAGRFATEIVLEAP